MEIEVPNVPMVRPRAEEVLNDFFLPYANDPETARALAVVFTDLLFKAHNRGCADVENYARLRQI